MRDNAGNKYLPTDVIDINNQIWLPHEPEQRYALYTFARVLQGHPQMHGGIYIGKIKEGVEADDLEPFITKRVNQHRLTHYELTLALNTGGHYFMALNELARRADPGYMFFGHLIDMKTGMAYSFEDAVARQVNLSSQNSLFSLSLSFTPLNAYKDCEDGLDSFAHYENEILLHGWEG